MHINYFGDLLWVTGYAIISRNAWALIIPTLLFCLFVFYNIPMLDAHLENKYKDQFMEYARTTKKFIPFIY
jgi:protein-S-isoprenylcysteine O-methyltransferase Ste14